MKFNPEDGNLTGPRCRNCHKGSSGCGACHNEDPLKDGVNTDSAAWVADNSRQSITHLFASMFKMVGWAYAPNGDPINTATIAGYMPYTAYDPMTAQSMGGLGEYNNEIATQLTTVTVGGSGVTFSDQFRSSREAPWSSGWRGLQTAVALGSTDLSSTGCSDSGFSFPHRTLGWKMLKDDLFGIDFNGDPIAAGQTRTTGQGYLNNISGGDLNAIAGYKTHDLDSVCLDCHNPTVWNATSSLNHTDLSGTTVDDMNDDVLLRGLP